MAAILRQVTVARDGMHNAFTDLQYWQGCYLVGYRKGASHVSMDGEAVVIAVETLTSSPVRFPRTAAGYSVSHDGLFPCGEGGGWAGGITSSAADGLATSAKVAARLGL